MTTPSILDSRYSWTRLLITLLIAVMGNVGMWAIIVVLPEVQEEFGAGRADVSLAYTLTMIGFALGNFYVGRAVDRFGITTSLIACALTLTVAYALAALSPSLFILTAMQFIIGFATACSFGPLIADISQWFLKRRGVAVAIAASGNYLSGAIWPLLLGNLAGDASWRWSYTALAVLTLIIIPPLAMMFPKGGEARPAAIEFRQGRSTVQGVAQRLVVGRRPFTLELDQEVDDGQIVVGEAAGRKRELAVTGATTERRELAVAAAHLEQGLGLVQKALVVADEVQHH